MEIIRPVFKKLLVAAVVVYVAGTAILLSDLFQKVGELEYTVLHLTGKCTAKH